MFARNRVLREVDQGGNTAAAEALIATNEPILSFDTAYNLQLAISQYEPFVAAGGWEEIPQEAYGLILGNNKQSVVALKRRLMSSGDMPMVENVNDMFDADTDRGRPHLPGAPRPGRQRQGRRSRPGTPWPSPPRPASISSISMPSASRPWRPTLSDRYVVVNIPAATIEAVEGGMVEQRHTAVVGRVDRATPIMASKIHQINFNPYWHVPKSLIETRSDQVHAGRSRNT